MYTGAVVMKVFTYYFWTFFLGAFLGVVIETVWCLLRYRKIESRKGLIFGPFNALYGFAAVALSFSINFALKKTIGNYFLIGVVVASLVEYFCSYFQEKTTGSVSWDYKDFKYNLNGRINLLYSLMWGLLTIVWAVEFMPFIKDLMPFFIARPLLTINMCAFMAFDCFISLVACIRKRQRREKIAAKNKFEKHLDNFYTDELLDKIYANSKYIDD